LNRERQDLHPTAVNKNPSYTRRYGHRSDHNILRQPFIRSHNETLSIAAMRVFNEDRSPLGING